MSRRKNVLFFSSTKRKSQARQTNRDHDPHFGGASSPYAAQLRHDYHLSPSRWNRLLKDLSDRGWTSDPWSTFLHVLDRRLVRLRPRHRLIVLFPSDDTVLLKRITHESWLTIIPTRLGILSTPDSGSMGTVDPRGAIVWPASLSWAIRMRALERAPFGLVPFFTNTIKSSSGTSPPDCSSVVKAYDTRLNALQELQDQTVLDLADEVVQSSALRRSVKQLQAQHNAKLLQLAEQANAAMRHTVQQMTEWKMERDHLQTKLSLSEDAINDLVASARARDQQAAIDLKRSTTLTEHVMTLEAQLMTTNALLKQCNDQRRDVPSADDWHRLEAEHAALRDRTSQITSERDRLAIEHDQLVTRQTTQAKVSRKLDADAARLRTEMDRLTQALVSRDQEAMQLEARYRSELERLHDDHRTAIHALNEAKKQVEQKATEHELQLTGELSRLRARISNDDTQQQHELVARINTLERERQSVSVARDELQTVLSATLDRERQMENQIATLETTTREQKSQITKADQRTQELRKVWDAKLDALQSDVNRYQQAIARLETQHRVDLGRLSHLESIEHTLRTELQNNATRLAEAKTQLQTFEQELSMQKQDSGTRQVAYNQLVTLRDATLDQQARLSSELVMVRADRVRLSTLAQEARADADRLTNASLANTREIAALQARVTQLDAAASLAHGQMDIQNRELARLRSLLLLANTSGTPSVSPAVVASANDVDIKSSLVAAPAIVAPPPRVSVSIPTIMTRDVRPARSSRSQSGKPTASPDQSRKDGILQTVGTDGRLYELGYSNIGRNLWRLKK